MSGFEIMTEPRSALHGFELQKIEQDQSTDAASTAGVSGATVGLVCTECDDVVTEVALGAVSLHDLVESARQHECSED